MMRRRLLLNQSNLKFNQIVSYGNFSGVGYYAGSGWTLNYANNIGTLTANTTSTNIAMWTNVNTIKGHKYLCIVDIKPSTQRSFSFSNAVSTTPIYNLEIDVWTTFKKIGVAPLTYTNITLRFLLNNPVLNEVNEFRKHMVIDLTSMYGEGNEPTDIAVIEQDCANIGHPLTEYQPYTPIS